MSQLHGERENICGNASPTLGTGRILVHVVHADRIHGDKETPWGGGTWRIHGDRELWQPWGQGKYIGTGRVQGKGRVHGDWESPWGGRSLLPDSGSVLTVTDIQHAFKLVS